MKTAYPTRLQDQTPIPGLKQIPVRVRIRHLYISERHIYRGHHGMEPGSAPVEEMESVHCVAGRGLEGDRYFSHENGHKGQITFFAWEVFLDMCRVLNVVGQPPSVLRRNVVTEGVDLNKLIGRQFEIQGILFEGTEECRPCYWMNRALVDGAEAEMAGRGGLRAKILTSGILRVAPGWPASASICARSVADVPSAFPEKADGTSATR